MRTEPHGNSSFNLNPQVTFPHSSLQQKIATSSSGMDLNLDCVSTCLEMKGRMAAGLLEDRGRRMTAMMMMMMMNLMYDCH